MAITSGNINTIDQLLIYFETVVAYEYTAGLSMKSSTLKNTFYTDSGHDRVNIDTDKPTDDDTIYENTLESSGKTHCKFMNEDFTTTAKLDGRFSKTNPLSMKKFKYSKNTLMVLDVFYSNWLVGPSNILDSAGTPNFTTFCSKYGVTDRTTPLFKSTVTGIGDIFKYTGFHNFDKLNYAFIKTLLPVPAVYDISTFTSSREERLLNINFLWQMTLYYTHFAVNEITDPIIRECYIFALCCMRRINFIQLDDDNTVHVTYGFTMTEENDVIIHTLIESIERTRGLNGIQRFDRQVVKTVWEPEQPHCITSMTEIAGPLGIVFNRFMGYRDTGAHPSKPEMRDTILGVVNTCIRSMNVGTPLEIISQRIGPNMVENVAIRIFTLIKFTGDSGHIVFTKYMICAWDSIAKRQYGETDELEAYILTGERPMVSRCINHGINFHTKDFFSKVVACSGQPNEKVSLSFMVNQTIIAKQKLGFYKTKYEKDFRKYVTSSTPPELLIDEPILATYEAFRGTLETPSDIEKKISSDIIILLDSTPYKNFDNTFNFLDSMANFLACDHTKFISVFNAIRIHLVKIDKIISCSTNFTIDDIVFEEWSMIDEILTNFLSYTSFTVGGIDWYVTLKPKLDIYNKELYNKLNMILLNLNQANQTKVITTTSDSGRQRSTTVNQKYEDTGLLGIIAYFLQLYNNKNPSINTKKNPIIFKDLLDTLFSKGPSTKDKEIETIRSCIHNIFLLLNPIIPSKKPKHFRVDATNQFIVDLTSLSVWKTGATEFLGRDKGDQLVLGGGFALQETMGNSYTHEEIFKGMIDYLENTKNFYMSHSDLGTFILNYPFILSINNCLGEIYTLMNSIHTLKLEKIFQNPKLHSFVLDKSHWKKIQLNYTTSIHPHLHRLENINEYLSMIKTEIIEYLKTLPVFTEITLMYEELKKLVTEYPVILDILPTVWRNALDSTGLLKLYDINAIFTLLEWARTYKFFKQEMILQEYSLVHALQSDSYPIPPEIIALIGKPISFEKLDEIKSVLEWISNFNSKMSESINFMIYSPIPIEENVKPSNFRLTFDTDDSGIIDYTQPENIVTLKRILLITKHAITLAYQYLPIIGNFTEITSDVTEAYAASMIEGIIDYKQQENNHIVLSFVSEFMTRIKTIFHEIGQIVNIPEDIRTLYGSIIQGNLIDFTKIDEIQHILLWYQKYNKIVDAYNFATVNNNELPEQVKVAYLQSINQHGIDFTQTESIRIVLDWTISKSIFGKEVSDSYKKMAKYLVEGRVIPDEILTAFGLTVVPKYIIIFNSIIRGIPITPEQLLEFTKLEPYIQVGTALHVIYMKLKKGELTTDQEKDIFKSMMGSSLLRFPLEINYSNEIHTKTVLNWVQNADILFAYQELQTLITTIPGFIPPEVMQAFTLSSNAQIVNFFDKRNIQIVVDWIHMIHNPSYISDVNRAYEYIRFTVTSKNQIPDEILQSYRKHMTNPDNILTVYPNYYDTQNNKVLLDYYNRSHDTMTEHAVISKYYNELYERIRKIIGRWGDKYILKEVSDAVLKPDYSNKVQTSMIERFLLSFENIELFIEANEHYKLLNEQSREIRDFLLGEGIETPAVKNAYNILNAGGIMNYSDENIIHINTLKEWFNEYKRQINVAYNFIFSYIYYNTFIKSDFIRYKYTEELRKNILMGMHPNDAVNRTIELTREEISLLIPRSGKLHGELEPFGSENAVETTIDLLKRIPQGISEDRYRELLLGICYESYNKYVEDITTPVVTIPGNIMNLLTSSKLNGIINYSLISNTLTILKFFRENFEYQEVRGGKTRRRILRNKPYFRKSKKVKSERVNAKEIKKIKPKKRVKTNRNKRIKKILKILKTRRRV